MSRILVAVLAAGLVVGLLGLTSLRAQEPVDAVTAKVLEGVEARRTTSADYWVVGLTELRSLVEPEPGPTTAGYQAEHLDYQLNYAWHSDSLWRSDTVMSFDNGATWDSTWGDGTLSYSSVSGIGRYPGGTGTQLAGLFTVLGLGDYGPQSFHIEAHQPTVLGEEPVAGRRCYVLAATEHTPMSSGPYEAFEFQRKWWVAPDLGMATVRYEVAKVGVRPGVAETRFDECRVADAFVEVAEGVWVPVSWRVMSTSHREDGTSYPRRWAWTVLLNASSPEGATDMPGAPEDDQPPAVATAPLLGEVMAEARSVAEARRGETPTAELMGREPLGDALVEAAKPYKMDEEFVRRIEP